MMSNRARDTGPELAVRRLLHSAGLRYRVDYRVSSQLRTRADVVFTRARVTVFIDGCFWHGCPDHATFPVANADYWLPKLARNRERDRETTDALAALGWVVLRFWEHEDPASVAARIADVVRARRKEPSIRR